MAIFVPRFLRQLRDVLLSAPADGEVLAYDDADGKWKNSAAAGGGGAPTTADYLVGTAQAGLSAEIVVGATPGGELGGTWASPTVDATHSGSSHAATQTAAEATAAAALAAHLLSDVVDGDAAGGVLAGTYPSPSFAADMATQAELNAHDADTTVVHGIADTSVLATDAELAALLDQAVILAPASSARNVIQPTAGAVIAAIVKAHAAQSVDLTQWQTSGSVRRTAINSAGELELYQAMQAYTTLGAGTAWVSMKADSGRELFGIRGYSFSDPFAAESPELLIRSYKAGVEMGTCLFTPDYIQFGSDGRIIYFEADALGTRIAFYGKPNAGTGDWFSMYLDTAATQPAWGVKNGGHEYLHVLAAIADADVPTSQNVQWYDDTIDATKIRFKRRDSAGTLVSGSVASEAFVLATKLDDLAAPDDNTDLNVSTTKHGLTPKLSNVATEYLSGTGAFSVPSGSGIPSTIVDAKGDLIAASAADTVARLAVGSNGQVLTADSAQATGIKWAAAAGGAVATDAIWDAKGDIVAASAADTAARLAVGTNGHVLTADSAQTLGVKWAAPDATQAELDALAAATYVTISAEGGLSAETLLSTQLAAPTQAPSQVMMPHQYGQAEGTAAPGTYARFSTFWVERRVTINRLLVNIGTSSGNIDVGIYDDDDTGGKPGTLLVSSGSIACPAAGRTSITVASTVLAPGRYWSSITGDNGTYTITYTLLPTLRAALVLHYYKATFFPLANVTGTSSDATTTVYVITPVGI